MASADGILSDALLLLLLSGEHGQQNGFGGGVDPVQLAMPQHGAGNIHLHAFRAAVSIGDIKEHAYLVVPKGPVESGRVGL